MIDSHCHLYDGKYEITEDELVKNFEDAGVECVLNIGLDYEANEKAKAQAHKYKNVYYSVGFYPEYCDKYNEKEFEEYLVNCLKDEKFLGIGEIGLDYYWTKGNKEKQIEVFESQIKLAKKYNVPFIVHNRDASGDVLDVLRRNAPYNRHNIIHCFSASLEWAREVMKIGFYISFSGSVTFNNAKNLQEVAKEISLDRLLVETDAPYLTPVPFRGQINEPKNVIHTAKFIADLRQMPYKEIEVATTQNFKRIFDM